MRFAEQHLGVEFAQRVDRLLVLGRAAVLVGRTQRGVERALADRVDQEGA